MGYAYAAVTETGFDETLERVRSSLAEQGFGVLTEIDIRATLAAKLGVEMAPYVILGACNPRFASEALAAVPSVGVFLPCNVVVRSEGGRTVIEAMDPSVIGEVVGEPGLRTSIEAVSPLIRAAVDAAAGSTAPR